MEPIFFEPFFREQIWGGRRLEDVLGKRLPPEGRFGESWEISAHPLHISRVYSGTWEGVSLDALWRQMATELWGPASTPPSVFPWLVKYLDCSDYLSVQVHPDDNLARSFNLKECGKYEVWVVVHCEPGGNIFAGLREGVGPQELSEALQNGSVQECLFRYTPRVGDVIVMPPGTVHSAGGGILVAEIQTPSDATFRLFDWNRRDALGRSRPLHLNEALQAINWYAGPCLPIQPEVISQETVVQELLTRCPFFTLRRWRVPEGVSQPLYNQSMGVWMILSGDGLLNWAGNTSSMKCGDTVLIPASCRHVFWQTTSAEPAVLLSCHPR